MTLLIIGLLLWILPHVFKRAAPNARGRLGTALGAGASKGVVAALIVLGLVLMIVGYRAAPFVPIYTPPGWGVHLNNLAMLAAVALFGMGHSKGRARTWLRNPMLIAVVVWASAHLLVNGDLASLILFGGLGLWAATNIALIDAREGPWTPPPPGPVSGDIRLVVITLVIFAIITAIHAWLGVWPFPR